MDLLVILGHATVATAQIYAHVAQRRLREAIDKLFVEWKLFRTFAVSYNLYNRAVAR